MRRECHEPVVTKETELVTSLFQLLNCLLAEFSDKDKASSTQLGDISRKIDGALIFALIWSTGASTDTKALSVGPSVGKALSVGPISQVDPREICSTIREVLRTD